MTDIKLTKAEKQALVDLGAYKGGYINSADGKGYYAGSMGYSKRPSKSVAATLRRLEGRGLVWTYRMEDGVTYAVGLEESGKAICQDLTPAEADESATPVKCQTCKHFSEPFEFAGSTWGRCLENFGHVSYFTGKAMEGQNRLTPEANSSCRVWIPKT